MPRVLPLIPSEPNYRVGTQLVETQYILDVRWNTRDAAWYMDLLQEDETPIRMGIKLVLGSPLGARTTDQAFPPGVFIAVDLSGAGRDATLDDMGVRVVVMFYTSDELA